MLEYDEEENSRRPEDIFNRMSLAAALVAFKGVDMDLYLKTTNEMRYFLEDFQEILATPEYTNKELTILQSYLHQGRQLIEDMKNSR